MKRVEKWGLRGSKFLFKADPIKNLRCFNKHGIALRKASEIFIKGRVRLERLDYKPEHTEPRRFRSNPNSQYFLPDPFYSPETRDTVAFSLLFLYRLKVRALTTKTGRRAWKLWGRLTRPQHHTKTAMDLIRQEVGGKSFVDIGCMWGVNGEYSFVAEQSGARSVIGVDVTAPTEAFDRKRRELGSNIKFIQGDGVSPEVMEKIGQVDVVLCAGVLYHHPSPYHMLISLRELCRETLILASATIPESGALRQAAVYYPGLSEKDRRLWDVARSHGGGKRWAINIPYDPAVGYSNWFWGMTPSCIRAMAETAGFRVEEVHALHPFACVFLCRAVAKVPDELRSSAWDSDHTSAL